MRIETNWGREWREGKLKLADFVGKKECGDWGKQGYVRSLKEAQGAAVKRRTMPMTDPDPHEKTSGPRDPALPGTETREQMGKRLQSEAEALLPKITERVGLPSRWNRQAIEIGDASEKWRGKKNLSCSIAIREIEAVRPARWRTLIHELLHGHSPVYNQMIYNELKPWEEAAVEEVQRMIRQEVLKAAGVEVSEDVLTPLDDPFIYNPHISALDSLRSLAGQSREEFWLAMLRTPLTERAAFVAGLSQSIPAAERANFIRQFSATRAIMREKTLP